MLLREVNNVHIADGEVNEVHLVVGGGSWAPEPVAAECAGGGANLHRVDHPPARDPVSRAAAAAEARAGFPARGGGRQRSAARAALARLLWNENGARKVPSAAALDRAISALPRGE